MLIWSPEGASVCDFPLDSAHFEVNRVKWNCDGRSLVVQDKVRRVARSGTIDDSVPAGRDEWRVSERERDKEIKLLMS